MANRKLTRLFVGGTIVLVSLQLFSNPAASRTALMAQTTEQAITQAASTEATATGCGCDRSAATPTLPSTPSTGATLAATADATPMILATQDASAPVRYVSFLPTDFRFNPNPDKPVVLVMVFSLIFQNQQESALRVEKPRFQLAINGVPWGDLSSTDFQMGQLAGHAEQGIVLQSLTLISKTTPAQRCVLTCLKTYQPVDLTLTGTLDTFPGSNKQTVSGTLVTRQVVVREHQ